MDRAESKSGFFKLAELERQQGERGKSYLEFLRVPAMSAGLYVLPAGGTDRQSPHKEDEMYFVIRGRAHMQVGEEDQVVSAGSVVFVAAGVEHCYYDIEEELAVLVFFAPAES